MGLGQGKLAICLAKVHPVQWSYATAREAEAMRAEKSRKDIATLAAKYSCCPLHVQRYAGMASELVGRFKISPMQAFKVLNKYWWDMDSAICHLEHA